MAMPPTVGFWLHSSGYWISTCEPPVPHHGLLYSTQVTRCDGFGGECTLHRLHAHCMQDTATHSYGMHP